MAFGVSLLCRDISDVGHLPRPHHTTQGTSRRGVQKRLAFALLGECTRDIVHGGCMEAVAFCQEQDSELGSADSYRFFQHGLEHRRKLAGRTADNFEHLSRGSLLLQRFTKLIEE